MQELQEGEKKRQRQRDSERHTHRGWMGTRNGCLSRVCLQRSLMPASYRQKLSQLVPLSRIWNLNRDSKQPPSKMFLQLRLTSLYSCRMTRIQGNHTCGDTLGCPVRRPSPIQTLFPLSPTCFWNHRSISNLIHWHLFCHFVLTSAREKN